MDITMPPEKAQELVRLLWGKIEDSGFNALSKNDFYDYVLYLYNRFNDVHFLDTLSNYENSAMLRVTEQKVKSSARNISLKYCTEEDKDRRLFLFFRKIADDPNLLTLNDEKTAYTFVADDLAIRYRLEGILKKYAGTSLDYHHNPELVKVSIKDFYALFSGVLAELRGSPCMDTAELEKQIGLIKKDTQKQQLVEAVKDGVLSIAGSISPLDVTGIKDVISKLIRAVKK